MTTSTEPKDGPRRRWPRRLAIGAAVATVLFGVLGFFVVPPIAKSVAQKHLTALLGRKVTIERIRVNPFALSVGVEGFQIYEADGVTPFVGWKRLYVNAQLSSVFRRAPIIEEVSLESLRVHVVRRKATTEAFADVESAYNFSDIVARLAAAPKAPEPPPAPAAAPPRFSLNNLRLTDGAVVFDDGPLGAHHEITELAIGVPFASTLPVYVDSFVQPGLSVRVDGTPFSIAGRTKPFKDSLETVLEVRLQALDLTKYVPFVPLALPFQVDSALVSLALDIAFVRPRAAAPQLTIKGTLGLDKLDVREKRKTGPEPLASLDKLEIEVGEADVMAQRFALDKVLVSGLEVHVRRERDGTLNLEHLAPRAGKPPRERQTAAERDEAAKTHDEEREEKHEEKHDEKRDDNRAAHKAEPEGAGPQFSLARFTLDGTTIHFVDESVSPTFEARVSDVALDVRGLSNAPGAKATMRAGLRAAPGGTVRQEGTLRLTPLEATGKLDVDGIELARFAPYYHDAIAFDVGQGHVRLGSRYKVEAQHERTSIVLEDAFFELGDLALRRRGARDDFFRLGLLAVRGAKVDLGTHEVTVAAIETHDGRVRATRDAKGVVDLTTLGPPGPASPPHRAAAPATPAKTEGAPPEPDRPWTVALARFDLDKWGARFEDHAVTPTAVTTIDPIALHATNVSTAPGAKLGLDLRLVVNKAGRLQITGTAALKPVAANLRVDLRGLELLPLQPYFHDQVSLTVTDGTVSVKAQAALKMTAAGEPQVNASADVDVADLATVDDANQEPLLAWKSFHVGGLKVTTPPLAIAIDQVSLTDFDARLVLTPDARFNLGEAFGKPGAPPPAKTPPPPKTPSPVATAEAGPPGPAVTIGQVTLQGGDVKFTDRSIRPSYTAELTDLAGHVSGLSSTPGTTADVDLRGAVDHSGVLTILGKANPLAKDLFADVQVSLRDFELPPASPYTGKYAGYGISKGKLDLSLDYKIADGKLDAKNKLVLDQFTFGDKVNSPDAVKLPVRLAVALLKDRHGVIDIDLPIAGSLKDPEFKIWHAVLKVLGNLVVKAVTAPFSLIASAFGGGDELSKIDFAPGLATLDATAQKRLATLTKALRERPGISFEIEGRADAGQDRDGLRRFLYERQLKAVKMTELVQAGAAVPSVDDLAVDAAEHDRLLGKVYAAARFLKPKNAIGLEKSLPPLEQEKLLLVNTRVDSDQLRDLALRRATAVQGALAKATAGVADRLFLVTPRLESAGHGVELTLKKD